jgi:hypothetical protein
MLDLAIASDLAVRATRAHAGSALPHAPVVEPRPAREGLVRRTRAQLATRLHRLAAAVEPRRREHVSTVCS